MLPAVLQISNKKGGQYGGYHSDTHCKRDLFHRVRDVKQEDARWAFQPKHRQLDIVQLHHVDQLFELLRDERRLGENGRSIYRLLHLHRNLNNRLSSQG